MKTIKNGSKFALPRKNAALERSKAVGTVDAVTGKLITIDQVSDEFTVAPATLRGWRRQAGIQGAVPAGFAKYNANKAAAQAAAATRKAFITPTLVDMSANPGSGTPTYKTATHIAFMGKTYKI